MQCIYDSSGEALSWLKIVIPALTAVAVIALLCYALASVVTLSLADFWCTVIYTAGGNMAGCVVARLAGGGAFVFLLMLTVYVLFRVVVAYCYTASERHDIVAVVNDTPSGYDNVEVLDTASTDSFSDE